MIVAGFDPGGKDNFGWCVLRANPFNVALNSPVGWAPRAHAALNSWWATCCPLFGLTVLGFCFFPLIRHRVAQAGQGISASTDETTSHSTKLANDASQVAGYV